MTTPPDLPPDFLATAAHELREDALIIGDVSTAFKMPDRSAFPQVENEKPHILDTPEGSGPFIILGCMYQAEAVAEFLATGTPHKMARLFAAIWLKAIAGMVTEISVGLTLYQNLGKGFYPPLTLAIVHEWPDPDGAAYGLHWVKDEDGKILGLSCRVGLWLSVKGWRYTPDPEGPHLQFHLKEAWKPE